MKVNIEVTDECMKAVENFATRYNGGFQFTGERLPNGAWSVPVDPVVLERITSLGFDYESVSEIILRLLSMEIHRMN